jgi:hypothetical protein
MEDVWKGQEGWQPLHCRMGLNKEEMAKALFLFGLVVTVDDLVTIAITMDGQTLDLQLLLEQLIILANKLITVSLAPCLPL